VALAYVLNNGNLGKFLNEMQSAPVPSKVDTKYLASRGYTGANDAYLPALLGKLGFTDKGGVPTPRWHDHRHTGQALTVRSAGMRDAYAGFFALYPDAHLRSEQEFTNWARSEDPKASPTTIKRAWGTFKAMLPLCDFSGAPTSSSLSSASAATPAPAATGTTGNRNGGTPPPPPPSVQVGAVGGITINIELQLPATADAEFFDQFFASMRKHLIDDNG
jgi:Family of unknown function (DUF5343)